MFSLRLIPFALWAALCFTGCLTGCEGGASCKEDCEEDDDCESGLGCFPTADGNRCLPSECSACLESNRTCFYNENTSDQEEGDSLMCEFAQCG